MTGAQALVATLVDQQVDVCFANPGTSEMHFLAALENPRMRSVLCLFEGVATGAADGWHRMKGTPACTLLHLGPGLANGLANLHNARRAGSGIVNVVGEHATAHLRYDAPLTSDVEGLARPISHWVRRAASADSIAADAAAAVAAARTEPARIATLILPGETSWNTTVAPPVFPKPQVVRPAPPEARVQHVARMLRRSEPTLLLLGGSAMRGRALELVGRVVAKAGCRVATQFFSTRIERGAGRTPLERVPYAVPLALKFLEGFRQIITVETGEPVAFFAYPEQPSRLKHADCVVHNLVEPGEDPAAAFEMLIEALGSAAVAPRVQAAQNEDPPHGKLDPISIARALAAAMPENAIVVDESLTTGREALGLTAGAAPHDMLQNMGGSIGFGTPVATGAAVACPGRRVICLVGDGSAMYTIQSLWTQAREQLDVTTVVFANHSYQILKTEFANMGFGAPGPQALAMIDIDRPRIDWQAMARSMGVPSKQVTTAEALHAALAAAVRETGPFLIEVAL
jgi:acetolactate synthase-1/2/3 large subunit